MPVDLTITGIWSSVLGLNSGAVRKRAQMPGSTWRMTGFLCAPASCMRRSTFSK